MKKRILALTLSLVMLLGLANVAVFADDSTSVPTLSYSTTAPDLSTIISGGLTASPEYSATAGEKLTADQISDIADTKYGVSVIGINVANRPVSTLVDLAWGTGNIGDTLTNGKKKDGAFDVAASGSKYDKYGNETTDGDYAGLITLNFGQKATISSFAWAITWGNLSACDIYTSDDGKEWTLKVQTAQAYRTDIAGNGSEMLGADRFNGSLTSAQGVFKFDFPTKISAQYLRIACTDSDRLTSNTRDILVFGAKSEIAVDAVQTTEVENATDSANYYDARFVASVSDSVLSATKAVKQINFKISASYTDSENTTAVEIGEKTYSVTNVYSKIIAAGEDVNASAGYKFALIEITDIPSDVNVTFTITPVIEFTNGSTVTGATATCTLSAVA